MEKDTKSFLHKNLIPSHICRLLEISGIKSIKDLCEFGEEGVKAIETSVREQTIAGTDFKSIQKKLVGKLPINKFSFGYSDKKKLLKLSVAARQCCKNKQKLSEKDM